MPSNEADHLDLCPRHPNFSTTHHSALGAALGMLLQLFVAVEIAFPTSPELFAAIATGLGAPPVDQPRNSLLLSLIVWNSSG